MELLRRNVHQILGVTAAAFGPELFDPASEPPLCDNSDIDRLACEWRAISQGVTGVTNEEWVSSVSKVASQARTEGTRLTRRQWLRSAQRIVSGMASNYDTPKLVLGQAIAIVAFIVAAIAVYLTSEDGIEPFAPLGVITLGYGAMMFASSYVEEEYQFWYWSTTIWLAFVGFRGMNRFDEPGLLVRTSSPR